MLIAMHVSDDWSLAWMCTGLAPGHPGMAPGVPAQMVSAPGQRVPFAGMPPSAATARVMQPVRTVNCSHIIA